MLYDGLETSSTILEYCFILVDKANNLAILVRSQVETQFVFRNFGLVVTSS
jgi:hypothetical protein